MRKLIIQRERVIFQQYVTITALDLMRRFILGLPLDIPYNFDLSKQENKG
ncbi:MAG: hypothetical protein GY786_23710 [Proteobacteria bacterium]|nr:hypothetical protein [Pseudomonadota bacterium]